MHFNSKCILERESDQRPRNQIGVIAGNLNAKVEREQIFQATNGTANLHKKSNDNETRLVNFASTKNRDCRIHKRTWKSSDGETFNQTDHVITDSRHVSDLMNVRSCQGPNILSDLFIVMANVRGRLSNLRNEKAVKRDIIWGKGRKEKQIIL